LENKVDIYPNPTKGEIFINSFMDEIVTISVSDVLGRKYKQLQDIQLKNGQPTAINCSDIPKGSYYITVKGSSTYKTYLIYIQ
jgi:hypothetical protein